MIIIASSFLSQNLQNKAKLHETVWRLHNRAPPEARRLAGFPLPKKGFVGFASFVTLDG